MSLSVICWLWSQPGGRAKYTDKQVGIWASMVSRNLAMPHKLFCFTDQKITKAVTALPLPEIPKISSPHWPPRRPQCYRRISAFNPEIRHTLGDRFVSVDLDCVITGGLDTLFDRPEDIVLNRGLSSKNCYNGSMWLYRPGTRDHVYSDFTPQAAITASAKYLGSDQAWFRQSLGEGEATWDQHDGVHQWLWLHRKNYLRTLPTNSRIIFFAGGNKPWDHNIQTMYRWVPSHYR